MRQAGALLLAATLTAVPGAVRADDAAGAWLARMGEALASRNYVGEFTHATASRVERLRIAHRVRGGHTSERLVSVGSGRELVRDGDEIICYLPDQKVAIIERRTRHGPLLGTLPQFDGDVAQWYDVESIGRETSPLGGAVQVIAVRPKDRFRFGYRLWIDERSAMPVRSELVDTAGKPVERVQFTRLEMVREVADAEFHPASDARGYRWIKQAPQPAAADPSWRVARVPPGFRLSVSAYQAMPGAAQPVRHLVFTDGLASVSVFISAPAPGKEPLKGTGQVGTAAAFSTVVQGHQVTAVGEVPPDTVKAIAGAMQPAAPAGPR